MDPVPGLGAAPPVARDEAAPFRPDVEGLRGIAVLLVVLFHVGLPVPGGFVGVDLFFVISGFLITGLLLRENERTGRVFLARFYARRLRRILPAVAVVVVATLGAAMVVVGPLDRPEVMADGAAAALSVANIRAALVEGDYFAALLRPSPLLHLWSLSVEEQFYLLWPALLFLVARGRRAWVGVVLVAVLAGSFAASVFLTDRTIGWAFYSLPTRAWQLALGGLLAVAAMPLARLPRSVVLLVGWAGAVALGASALLLGGTPYPGLFALAPTLAGAALILSGPDRLGPGRILGLAPLRWVGRISYSLYLWHWPILVLVPLAVGTDLPIEARGGLALVAVVFAWLSWRFVEEPFRHGRLALALSTRRAISAGLATIVALALLAGGLGFESLRAVEALAGTTANATPTPAPTATPTAPTAGPTGSPAGSATPRPTATPTALPTVEPTLPPLLTWREIPDLRVADPIPLPADVRPSLVDARTDTERLYRDHCASQWDDLYPASCVYGVRSGTFTVALVGDSHAGEWFPAIEAVAAASGWRLVPYVKLSCPFLDMRVENFAIKREYTECESWREEVVTRLVDQPPDLTIVAMSHRGIFPILPADASLERQSQAIARLVARIPGRVAIMVDTPRTNTDIPGCIAEHPSDVRSCAIARSEAFSNVFGVREARAAELSGAGVVDLIPHVCPAMPCQVVRDGMIVYRDNHHLTATFSASLAPDLSDALRRLLPGTSVAPAGALAPTSAPTPVQAVALTSSSSASAPRTMLTR